MSKVVTAEYDAAANALRLEEPLEGLADRQKVKVTIDDPPADDDTRPWLRYRGILSDEAGDEFARALNEMFPPWTGDDD